MANDGAKEYFTMRKQLFNVLCLGTLGAVTLLALGCDNATVKKETQKAADELRKAGEETVEAGKAAGRAAEAAGQEAVDEVKAEKDRLEGNTPDAK
jgi:hypothetical protein